MKHTTYFNSVIFANYILWAENHYIKQNLAWITIKEFPLLFRSRFPANSEIWTSISLWM